MVALSPDFLRDRERAQAAAEHVDTEAVLLNLRGFARSARSPQQAEKIRWQIEACEKHLAIQRANLDAAA